MSVRPFCFIHATNLRLDQPLWGVGTLTRDARRIAEDATLLAFEHVVEACLAHRVACLLLTGNCFDAAHAFRARLTLEAACERLDEQGIEVLVVPGETDSAEAWTTGLHLPQNVTTFTGQCSEPVAIVRDNEVLATVQPYDEANRHDLPNQRSNSLRIGLVGAGQHPELQQWLASSGERLSESRLRKKFPQAAEFGYLALGNGSERILVNLPGGLAHDPGCTQPLDGRETDSMGCSLIEVDRAGQLRVKRVPTAVVRREDVRLTLTPQTTWDGLVQGMQTALVDHDPLPTEKLWLVRWTIEGEGPLAESLAEAAAQRELCELVEQELADDRGLIRQHEIEMHTHWPRSTGGELPGTVFEEFRAIVDAQLAEHISRFRGRLPGIDWPEAGWIRHIIDSGDRMLPQAVAAHAHDEGRQCLLR
jgi:hypothetical protein